MAIALPLLILWGGLVPAVALAHTISPLSLEILVGATGTFIVRDAADCPAEITVSPANPAIVSVEPVKVNAISHEFTVRGLQKGSTTIKVDWRGSYPPYCTEVGSGQLEVVVRDGAPDLMVELVTADLLRRETAVVASHFFVGFRVRNIGTQPTNGLITVQITTDEGVLVDFAQLEGNFCGSSADLVPPRCESTISVPPGSFLEGSATLFFDYPFFPDASATFKVEGGGDVNLANNTTKTFVDTLPARQLGTVRNLPIRTLLGRR